ncbi:RNA-directed DNA methylation 4 [Striga hermonthica]|uniref:RNA-directed DNA methylation 4 n=1 Tax=Striga hermonthica TaxID=68872 RepID=A0A9N7R8R8_STRHE|nr:RNA-directed DNA methylation 4 [Striga hermonthica]
MAESSSCPPSSDKPVIVRVKRKAFQSALDAFWLEIHERPLKRPLLDFGNLSISDDSSSKADELKTKKILVRHVETVSSAESTFDVLRSFVPNLSGELNSAEKTEGKRSFKTVNKQDQILVKAKQSQEVVDTNLDDHRMMAQYLPLLRDFLPSAAVEIESDIHDLMSKQGSSDGYVYDFYAVNEDADLMEADSVNPFPLVRVDDDDEFYDGPDDSEYETDDSNAENNPLNDYPDEETTEEDEDEVTSSSSDEKSENESRTSGTNSQDSENETQVSFENDESYDWTNDVDEYFEDESYSDGDNEPYY